MNLFQKIWRIKNYRIAFILALVMLLWLLSGLFVGDKVSDAETNSDDDLSSLPMVKARIIHAEIYTSTLPVRARTEPNRAVEVKAEVSGRVIDLPVDKGAYVESGAVICELDTEDRQEILEQAEASLKKAEIDYEGALRLQTGGFQSQSEIAQANASLGAARAAYRRAEIDLENLEIRAPFDGFVNSRPVEIGDLMQPGGICAEVLDVDPLLITGSVNENAVTHINLGDEVSASLITGESLVGSVRFIERSADEITRTFRVETVVPNDDLSLFSGLSAQLIIPVGEVSAHAISSSLLVLADSGELGVKILDDEDRVEFVLVDLVADNDSGVWVTGLPEETKLITLGQQYVFEGQKVEATLEQVVEKVGQAAQ